MTTRRARGLASLALATLALAPVVVAPTHVLAADPTFGRATATAAFGESIAVEQRITLPSDVARVEAYVRTNAGSSTFLAAVANPGAGEHVLRYTYETPGGSLMPNTRVSIGFRVTVADGAFVDGPPADVRYEDDRFDWRTLEGATVRIHWYEGNEAFGRRALEIGDKAVQEAAALLGVQETEPIDFYVYADRSAFYDILGNSIQENVGGLAIPELRTLFANIGPSEVADPWVSIVVPHELTHVVFDTATRNPYREPLHWLNEGLADYLAQGYASDARANVERNARSGDLMPLSAIRLQFPSTADRFSLAYDESVSAIDFLIRTYGQDALVKLIRSYADGVSDDEAFRAGLGVDVAAFEAGWLEDLGVEQPVPFGPRPAPVGPLAPGWTGAPAASGPPVATPPPVIDERAELGTTIAIGALVLFGMVILLGILLAARGLNRGEPFPVGGRPAAPRPAPGEWGSGQWAPDRDPDEPPPAPGPKAQTGDDELPPDLRELDARFGPSDRRDPPAGASGDSSGDAR